VHLQEGTSHLGGKQQLPEQKTVVALNLPETPPRITNRQAGAKSFIAGVNAGLFQRYIDPEGEAMPGESACPELLTRIRQLEEETARLQLLIAELVLKNQHLRRDIRAAGVFEYNWTEVSWSDGTGNLRKV